MFRREGGNFVGTVIKENDSSDITNLHPGCGPPHTTHTTAEINKGNSRPTDQPHRKPVSHRSWAGDAVRLEAVGWRIEDVAVMRHLRLVGTIPGGTEALDREGSWTPWTGVLVPEECQRSKDILHQYYRSESLVHQDHLLSKNISKKRFAQSQLFSEGMFTRYTVTALLLMFALHCC